MSVECHLGPVTVQQIKPLKNSEQTFWQVANNNSVVHSSHVVPVCLLVIAIWTQQALNKAFLTHCRLCCQGVRFWSYVLTPSSMCYTIKFYTFFHVKYYFCGSEYPRKCLYTNIFVEIIFQMKKGNYSIGYLTKLSCSFFSVEILEPPKSMNVTIDETVRFTCKAIGLITFEVDNRAIDPALRSQGFDDSSPEVPDEDDPSINMRALIVDGRNQSNGSKISCSVFSTSPLSSARSPAALLLVFKPSMLHCYLMFLHKILSSFFF